MGDIDTTSIKTLTQEEQVLVRPSMYIGGADEIVDKRPIYKNQIFVASDEKYSQQSQKLFEEIFQNSIDNYTKSDSPEDYYINVDVDKRQFKIRNNGNVFKLNDKNNSDVDRIFQSLNTSDQYGKKNKVVSGANGAGAKLVNLFSKRFQITVQNNNILYMSEWKNQKKEHSSKIILENIPDDKFFQADVELLDLNTQLTIKELKINYNFSDLNLKLIQKYLIDVNFAFPKIKITFNGKLIKTFSENKFLELHGITNFYKMQWEKVTMDEYKNKQTQHLDIYIFKPQTGTLIKKYSLINGIQSFNQDNQIYKDLQQQIKEKSRKNEKLQLGYLVIGLASVDYSEQVKDKITTKLQFTIKNDLIQFIQTLYPQKIAKQVFLKKLYEANKVNKQHCTLIITEGDSAACLFTTLYSLFPQFRDSYGLFPLRGKIYNVKDKESSLDIKNEEIKNLIQIIGLTPDGSVKYDKDSIEQLRYKKVLVASDYDVDGFHIKGLFINLVNQFWPELIKLDFIQEFMSPIITCYNQTTKQTIEFFSQMSFDNYKIENQTTISKVKYFKGLGSFTEAEIKHIGQNFDNYVKQIQPTTKDYQILIYNMFGKDSDIRKDLINEYVPQDLPSRKPKNVPLEYMIQQVIEYSVESLERAIPNLLDGLKDSQRKIIYYCMTHNYKGAQNKLKVSQLAGKISADLDYHHGEASLQGAIVKLAQSFSGSNNCNLLFPEGNYGTRFEPDKCGSARYIFTYNSEWMYKLFSPDDKLIYKYNKSDDGEDIEPQKLFPIVPLQIINGCKGIATGWSSEFPCYNLKDVINYIKQSLTLKKVTQQLEPFYNDYQGKITMNEQIMVCEAKFQYNQEKNILEIWDTTIQTSMFDLEEFLKEKQLSYTRNESLILKKCDQQLFDEINKKFLYSTQKLSKMNCLFDKKIYEYNDIYEVMDQWIKLRLQYYRKRKIAKEKQLVKDYLIKWNILQIIQRDYLKNIKYSDIFLKDVQNLMPFYVIQQWNQNMEETLKILKKYKNVDLKTTDYNYLTDKTVKFYYNFKKEQLDEILEQYTEYHQQTEQQIWIQDLDKI